MTPPRRLGVMAISAAATLLAALVLVVLASLFAYHGPGPKARSGEITTVFLRPGAGLGEIAANLEREGVVRSSSLFAAAAQITGSATSLKAGEYEFPSGGSMAKVLRQVREGKVVRHLVTIPEGVTSEMAVEILMAQPVLTGAAPVPEEGSILPETYEVRRGEDRAEVLKRMMQARDKVLAELWSQRQEGLPFSTPQEAVILASIVEKETGKAEERPRIAGLFVNRMRTGMRLQSDPTIIYGVTRGRPLGRAILQSEIDAVTPYNTYAIDGLPVGPIANPGRDSLAAVLDPAQTDEVYFVADGAGGHVFAKTYEEHQRNVARWRVIKQKQQAAPAPAGKGK